MSDEGLPPGQEFTPKQPEIEMNGKNKFSFID